MQVLLQTPHQQMLSPKKLALPAGRDNHEAVSSSYFTKAGCPYLTLQSHSSTDDAYPCRGMCQTNDSLAMRALPKLAGI
jgi:hypothetical protein